MAAQADELSTVDDCEMVATQPDAERALLTLDNRKRKRSQDTDPCQDHTKKSKLTKIECEAKSMDSIERKRKRSQDTDDGHHSTNNPKKMKTESTTKITDLNADCFGHIFDHLRFRDLLNVADLNEKATEAAELVFTRRYSNYNVVLCGHETSRSIEIDDNTLEITITTASQCANVLRNFGDVIGKLKLLNFNGKVFADRRWAELRRLINEKCTKHVTVLELSNCDRHLLADIENVFECVGVLKIACSQVGEKFMDLSKWFPQLRTLELLHHENCGQIICNYPHLSYLTMDTTQAECLSTGNFKAMLKSVPQLESLSLSGGMKSSLLAFIADSLPKLKKLHLWDFHIENQSDAVIVFKNVQTFSVSTGLLGDLPTKIPFKMGKLTELSVKTELLCNEWIDYAMQKQDLKKLRLISTSEPTITDIQLNAMATALPKLIHLDITADISTDGLKHFLAANESVHTIQIRTYGQIGKHLMASANDEWTTAPIRGGVAFQRKMDL